MMLRSRSVVRCFAALVLLGALGVGSVCHLWHHLSDPDCAADPRHATPCGTCAALHGLAITPDLAVSGPPDRAVAAEVTSPPAKDAATPAPSEGAPRGPPRA